MIKVTAPQIDRAIKLLNHIPGAAPKAIFRAINRAADTARTEAARKVRETYYIDYGAILSTIRIRKATNSRLSARVTSRGHATPLYAFRVTPKQISPKRKTPIIVKVKRGEGGPIKRAFVAKIYGMTNIYERVGKKRIPVRTLYGPPIPQMIGNKTVAAWVEQKAVEKLNDRIDHEISRELEAFEG
ncbi:hypothetical protein EHS13_13755 [Paenibacillus psychroresistens]|uniref:Uncharacterized protein n=1 Tax=Paenibacillus psychroresistens TaxID=1778678 RepID=A0A6B8RJF4_9BACL|nr:phage tail protein [Paenibacillus psychroresistens]QGQ95864.1 hypothetical protein EHS13_13755 [Paenibacillus psychroresistens]